MENLSQIRFREAVLSCRIISTIWLKWKKLSIVEFALPYYCAKMPRNVERNGRRVNPSQGEKCDSISNRKLANGNWQSCVPFTQKSVRFLMTESGRFLTGSSFNRQRSILMYITSVTVALSYAADIKKISLVIGSVGWRQEENQDFWIDTAISFLVMTWRWPFRSVRCLKSFWADR